MVPLRHGHHRLRQSQSQLLRIVPEVRRKLKGTGNLGVAQRIGHSARPLVGGNAEEELCNAPRAISDQLRILVAG